MKVVLTQDVKSQGKKGQVIEVSEGYARNFLFAKKLAIPADNAALNDIKNKEAAKKYKIEEDIKAAKALGEKIEATEVVIKASGSADGRMYGSITNKDVAEALSKQGITVDKKKIELSEPIKSFGSYTAVAKLYSEVSAKIKIKVVNSNE